jgi:hypothetical protein
MKLKSNAPSYILYQKLMYEMHEGFQGKMVWEL